MQAIILAAGMGKRLGRYTKDATKCMVSVNGKTLIEHTIETLAANNVSRLIVVTGYRSAVLTSFISKKFTASNLNGMKIEYIENTAYNRTNNIYSLYLARNEMIKDDTLLLESDVIFKRELIANLIKNKEKNLAVVSPFESWMDGTCTLLDKDGNITGMLDKAHFKWSDVKDYYKTVNIYKFSADFAKRYYVPFLEAYQKSFGKNEYYEQVLKVLSFLSGTALKAMIIHGDDWYEIDDPADLAIAENRFAKGKEKLTLLQKRYGGYWRFPQIKDFCWLVNPYFPPENMVHELTANFYTLLTQYPSGAAQHSLLAGKIFNVLPEHIAVGNGAAELIASCATMITGKVAIPYPTFNEYPERLARAEIVSVPVHAKNFSYTANDIIKTAHKENVRAVLLINPDNPSGNFLAKKDVLQLCRTLKEQNAQLIFDESFIDFAQKEKRYTLIDEAVLHDNPNLIVIKSISKSYGVPGLRLGVIASADAAYIKKIQKCNAIWNINSFAEYYLQIYDKYKKSYEVACDQIAAERARFIMQLRKLPHVTVFPSEANFVLCRLDGTISATKLATALLEKYNIFVKDLSGKQGFKNGNFIRLAIRDKADNNMLLDALQSILK
ncbi:MAG: aminotransferase class I/II-fold pyridoxal phosphate-dependent enzyme [Treponema sp.]|nr:aminotransferase class I/II-fold pyridoxal phosphate-dependent enzyme [Treponema sp.]